MSVRTIPHMAASEVLWIGIIFFSCDELTILLQITDKMRELRLWWRHRKVNFRENSRLIISIPYRSLIIIQENIARAGCWGLLHSRSWSPRHCSVRYTSVIPLIKINLEAVPDTISFQDSAVKYRFYSWRSVTPPCTLYLLGQRSESKYMSRSQPAFKRLNRCDRRSRSAATAGVASCRYNRGLAIWWLLRNYILLHCVLGMIHRVIVMSNSWGSDVYYGRRYEYSYELQCEHKYR